jgi:hypothetical protein
MKRQLVVADVEHLFEKSCPHDLLGRQALAPLPHADAPPASEIMSYRGQGQCRRVEHAAHLEELRGARMLRHGGREREPVVVESTHRGPRRSSGGIGVFPGETDGPSIPFPLRETKFSFVFAYLPFPDEN